MAYYKKILALLLCVLTVTLCSCGTDSEVTSTPSDTASSQSSVTKVFSLFYSANDTLNPYTCVSKHNRELITLLYDPLVRLNTQFQPEFIIAENIELTGKSCVITLRDICFTNGDKVTAEDVVYSYKLANSENSIYSHQLGSINKMSATDEKTVTVTLNEADPYFVNLLDFPIIKAKSDTIKDENKMLLTPVGSGRYVVDTDNEVLVANDTYFGVKPNISTINLINAPDSDVVKYNLEAGNISIYNTDLSDGTVPSMVGTASTVNINNLVYLGVNLRKTKLSDVKIRYAISSALSRADICKNAYFSYAVSATGLFHPEWNDAKGLQNIQSEQDLQNTVANLKDLCYTNKDTEGFYVDDKGKNISLTLVAYSGNERRLAAARLIAEQLKTVGFKVTLKELNWDDYVSALTSGDFDLYIAETKLTNNMDVRQLVATGGRLAYGIPTVTVKQDGTTADGQQTPQAPTETVVKTAIDQAVDGFYNEDLSLIDIINAFNAEMPIIPVCYRYGLTVCDANLNNSNISSVSDVYYGIANINFK